MGDLLGPFVSRGHYDGIIMEEIVPFWTASTLSPVRAA